MAAARRPQEEEGGEVDTHPPPPPHPAPVRLHILGCPAGQGPAVFY